jgi:hypothetical protein
VIQLAGPTRHSEVMSRRRMLWMGAAAAVTPFLGPFPFAHAATPSDLHFRALWKGRSIGEHVVTFRTDGDRLMVETHIDIVVKVLFFTAFRLKHHAQEIWQSGRLVSVTSTTDRDKTHLQVSGHAVEDGFLIVGQNGPFLAAGNLLTTNALWDSRILSEVGLIDVQYGGEVGLVVKPLGDEQVDTPQGPVRASRHQIITPHYAGSVFYDGDQRWVRAVVELKGETIEYALAA